MTNAEIAKLLAERVRGLKLAESPEVIDKSRHHGHVSRKGMVYVFDDLGRSIRFNPAESIADAVEALEKWLHVGTHRSYELRQAQSGAYGPQATVWNPDQLPVRSSCSADTLSMAISRALLAAHGIEA